MNKTIIIHCHSLYCGGIGDFIRASLSFYSFCQRNNIEYYIDFKENPHLKQCFDINLIPDLINYFDSEEICLLNGYYSYDNIKNELNKILNNPKVYYLKTNAIGFENLDEIRDLLDKLTTASNFEKSDCSRS